VDVFCAPSTGGESFGIVLLEAMACGRPIVCSGIAGYGEVVRDGCVGILVPPGDPPTFAAALVRLLGDAELRRRMSMAGLRRAAEFDWKLVTQQVEAYYLAVLAGADAARNHGLRPPSEQPRLAVA